MLGNILSSFLGLLLLWQVLGFRRQRKFLKGAKLRGITPYEYSKELSLDKKNLVLQMLKRTGFYRLYMLSIVQRCILILRVIFIIVIVCSFILLLWILTTKYGEILR